MAPGCGRNKKDIWGIRMSMPEFRSSGRAGSKPAYATALLTLCLALSATAARADAGLRYFKNYFVTGDYVSAGVALRGAGGSNGLATGQIRITQGTGPGKLPAGAEVIAAYLYWQTVAPSGTPAPSVLQGAKFKGQDLSQIAVQLGGGAPPCVPGVIESNAVRATKSTWSYRADVLRFFPRRRPANTSQPVVAEVAGSHEVVFPEKSKTNQLPSTLGAALVIVYRVSGYDAASNYQKPKMPLRSIVLYEGGATVNNSSRQFGLTLEGFYEASRTAPAARMTQILSNGLPVNLPRLFLRSTKSAADNRPFLTLPLLSLGGFTVATTDALPLEPGAMKATFTLEGGGIGPCDCQTWSAIVLSTEVQDRDGDGLLDVWESKNEWTNKPARLGNVYGAWPLKDPNGTELPNLQAMGASPTVQDVFVQIDYLKGDESQGDYHNHLPTLPALRSVATAFRNAAPRPFLVAQGLCAANAPRGQCPINVHFDVGANYVPPASCATTWSPDCSIVPSLVARGGNAITETTCTDYDQCAFPYTPGVVRWKTGFRRFRDGNVGDSPALSYPRFARNRKDMFRYALFAHALGIPSPTDAKTPRRTSGIGDSSGGDLMVTLGLWDNQTGSDFVQASTLMHELGHTFGLRHGGVLTSGLLEANCKPNYQSVMNYLFQVRGLLNAQGTPVLDFSRQQLPTLYESTLSEPAGFGAATEYLPRWYAPQSSSFIDNALGTTPATRRCDGSLVNQGEPSYVRIDADPRRTGLALDWNGDGTVDGPNSPRQSQDANFDGVNGEGFTGANDFWTMDLRQTGARRPVGSKALRESVVDPATGQFIGGGLSLDTTTTGYGDLGYGDLGYGDLGYGDLGYGDLGYGDLGYGDLGYGDLGYGDLGYGDLGYGDLGVPADANDPIGARGDVTLDTAATLGNSPSGLAATTVVTGAIGGIRLSWTAPNVGYVYTYQVWRVTGSSVTATNFADRRKVADVYEGDTYFVDTDTLVYGQTYTYFVVATLAPLDCYESESEGEGEGEGSCDSVQSGVSNFATVTFTPTTS
jgi:hypothetical protein